LLTQRMGDIETRLQPQLHIMARIRKIEIRNFRGIKECSWFPSPGINCLIGPGDSCKSSILDAIEFCIGARRTLQITDADFHRLDVEKPIEVIVTIGELTDALKSIEGYGLYVRSFDPATGEIDDEPEVHHETVLSVKLAVASDLEPVWTLVSDRAEAQGQSRNLNWPDRVRLAPTRIGVFADYHLAWSRGSVLNRISEERADASAALAKAARDARQAFGDDAQAQLAQTLQIVETTAAALGIEVGSNIRAMLDAHSVSFSGGTISLHSEAGIPLRGLGTGSARLLIAGLQRKAAAESTILLVDETEHGLEPHRIVRFLHSLGAKEPSPPLQVFMTTHSPVVVRELSGSQLCVVRKQGESHKVLATGTADDIQSTVRLYPEALLARRIIVCEGASEVGFVRGIDQFRSSAAQTSINAAGVALVDCGGGDADRCFQRALTFSRLGYETAVVRDSDLEPTAGLEVAYAATGGKVTSWRDGRRLEQELFYSVSDACVAELIDYAIELHGEELLIAHTASASNGRTSLAAIRDELAAGELSDTNRVILGTASSQRKAGWYKSITWMEHVGRNIAGPDLEYADSGFVALIERIFT
jgi:putative ATP-dependent endonuclease of OLD family